MLSQKNQTRSPRVLISPSMMIVVTIIIAVVSSVSYGQSCQSHQGSSFTFRPMFSGDSTTVSIGLSPCETVSLSEVHDMHGDPNKGTNIRMTYMNGSGQTLRSEQFAGIFSGGYTFPAGAPWPFPWRGTVSANWTVATLKIESYGAYGKGADNQEPEYNFTLSYSQRNGYNTAGDSFGSAANAALPSTYQGSFYDSTATPSDAGQYFKVHLKCNQAMYVYGSATGSSQYGAGFRVDIYDSNQTLLTPFGWKSIAAYGTATFVSNPFTNPNNAEADFYIRVKSTGWPVYDFTLNIEEYVASNSQTTPRTTAADATGSGGAVSSEEYHLPSRVDDDVLTTEQTELWAKLYWPTSFSGGPYPLVVFLHGNHGTCGRSSNPRIDDGAGYTFFGVCSSAPLLGANPFSDGLPQLASNNFTGWVGMRINVGSRPLVVTGLGRMFIFDNSPSHTVKIVRVSDLTEIATTTVTRINNPTRISYALLANPVTLSANTQYYVVSQETNAGDFWYESEVIPSSNISNAATITGSVTSTDGATNWSVNTTPSNAVNGPVDLLYDFTDEAGYRVVPNHLGYEYLANQLASRGYIVASINANRSITSGADDRLDDPAHIFSRGRLVLRHLETLKGWNSGPTAFIANRTLGTLRNDASGWYGMTITTGAQPITVHSLGRMFATGNTGTHSVKIVRANDSSEVGSASISMTGGTSGSFQYANLASPVTLAANTTYHIASQETAAGDSWYDSNTSVTPSSTPATLAAVNGRVSSTDGTTWSTAGATANSVYGPLDFKFQVVSVNLTGKIDFANVGLMGHSRGGQGMRAAYNLYRNPSIDSRGVNINWSNRIPGLSIKGIFEIAPTDNPVPVAGSSSIRYLNADGTAWNVLLPMCDGDVINLAGIRAFDRIMPYTGNVSGVPSDNPATQKSTFAAWGTNHNFFNTEWQTRDPFIHPTQAPCAGTDHNAIFPHPPTDGSGSANQQTIGSATLLAFFRANVGASVTATFNQNFNPLYNLPSVVTSVTPADRGFTVTPNSTQTKVIFDFLDPALPAPNPTPPSGTSYNNSNTDFSYGRLAEHDYATNPLPEPTPDPLALMLGTGNVTWQSASCNTYFQANWKNPGSGESISAYKTLDFRITRRFSNLNGTDPTNFQIQLVKSDGTLAGAAVSLKSYLRLVGPVGANLQNGVRWHEILQTVRIPLTDFSGASLSSIRGVRFTFSDTSQGAITLANIRLSKVN